jgi:hypothetical protein
MTPKRFCQKYKIKNYTINPDDTIDVNGVVDLYNMLGNMEKLPVRFGKVFHNFSCYGNNLTTLEGCPNYVSGNFLCDFLTHHILGNVKNNIYYDTIKQRIVI